jgi:hypothetical protein
MTLILWKDIEEVETFVLDEVFSLTDEEKRVWIIVVEGQPQE